MLKMMANHPPAPGLEPWTKPMSNHLVCKSKSKEGKPPQAFINDSEGFRLRAACVCLRSTTEEEVLLVTSPSGRGWIIPGGKVDPSEANEPAVSAMREAREEAGVVGNLGRRLGVFENSERGHRTTVFVMYVDRLQPEEVWEESVGRRRQWFPITVAKQLLGLYKPNHVKYLDTLETSGGERAQQK